VKLTLKSARLDDYEQSYDQQNHTMAVLRCGRARFARGDRSEAAAVVPLDMPGFLRSGHNFVQS